MKASVLVGRITSGLCHLSSVLIAIAALACDAPEPFGGVPHEEGTIVSRGPGTMLVIDSGLIAEGHCRTPIQFWFDPDVAILRNGVRLDTSALTVGRRVSVVRQQQVTKDCPAKTGALLVLLE